MKPFFRLMFSLVRRPSISFFFYFIIIAAIALASDRSKSISLFLIAFPWVASVFLLLNLPFMFAAFRQFTMPESKKINHVLEHGTIYFLKKHPGEHSGIGGRADYDGFRITGVNNKKRLEKAFNELMEYKSSKDQWEESIISEFCGSNIVTAQGFGIILLTLSGFILVLFKIKPPLFFAVLGFNLIIYFLLRYPIGKWIQRKLYLSFDFETAKIIGIKAVKKAFFESGRAHFVQIKIIKRGKNGER